MTMFVIYVEEVPALRRAIFPLLFLAKRADLKCTRELLSLIVSRHSPRFVAALRLSPTFFTCFGSHGDGVYRHRIFLDFFSRNLCTLRDDGLTLTILLEDGQGLVPLKFENTRTGYLQYSALILLPPHTEDVPDADFRIFVVIDPVEFREVARQLSVYNDIIRVTATANQIKFSVASEEVVLTRERSQCAIGGVEEGAEDQFQIYLNPIDFFIQASLLANLVWLLKSPDSLSMMSFPIGSGANIMVKFPQ